MYIDARTSLAPLELEVAMLVRVGIGRNAVAASLGVSKNTVKTILRRIRQKLGEDWAINPSVLWPPRGEAEPARKGMAPVVADLAAIEQEEAEKRLHETLHRQRRLSFSLLIRRSSNNQTVIAVSGAQRFWLKPAIKYLTEARHLRFLYVDHFDVFAPPWLPLANRGRGAVKAAFFSTTNEHYVLNYLNLYLEHDLPAYVEAINKKLDQIRNMTAGHPRTAELPTREELMRQAMEILRQTSAAPVALPAKK
ncbi:MAG: hypothetical protein D9V47_05450 [Clostridia bacterium]|nr:MAG: hypothetical protein D9V47_05450 [Clostridia bacterium]